MAQHLYLNRNITKPVNSHIRQPEISSAVGVAWKPRVLWEKKKTTKKEQNSLTIIRVGVGISPKWSCSQEQRHDPNSHTASHVCGPYPLLLLSSAPPFTAAPFVCRLQETRPTFICQTKKGLICRSTLFICLQVLLFSPCTLGSLIYHLLISSPSYILVQTYIQQLSQLCMSRRRPSTHQA